MTFECHFPGKLDQLMDNIRMNLLRAIHHAAIICSNHEVSKTFYVNVLGLELLAENYRAERLSYKLHLALR